MNELTNMKTIREIAQLEGKQVDDKDIKVIYEKVANTYIDTLLNKEADRIMPGPNGNKIMVHTKADQDAAKASWTAALEDKLRSNNKPGKQLIKKIIN
jgi:hypothetical protein